MRAFSSFALASALCGALCLAGEPTIPIYVDRDETLMRAGASSGVTVGTTVAIVGAPDAGQRHLGTGTVMEVRPAVARLSLDAAASADKSQVKFAIVEKKAAAKVPPLETLTPPPPPPVATNVQAPPSAAAGRLGGHATFRGPGHFKVLILTNEDARAWTHCTLTLPGNLVYQLDQLAAGDHESITLGRFRLQGAEREVPMDFVAVRCAEGSGTFVFPE